MPDEKEDYFAEVLVTHTFRAMVNVPAENEEEAELMIRELTLVELEEAHLQTEDFSLDILKVQEGEW